MIRNYIKIAWRNLVRNKVSSIINISGLAIGLACVMLIGLYVKDELGYDRIFKDANRIYRVNTHEKIANDEFVAGHTPPPVGRALQSSFPEIESYTRIFTPGDEIIHYVKNGERAAMTEKSLLSVDSNFLQFFGYPMLAGGRNKCLNGPNYVVLTESAAKKYFGDVSPIGKTLTFDEYNKPFTVTAVLKNLPEQSSLQFEMLQSNLGMPLVKRFSWSWVWLQMGTYVKLRAHVPNTPADIQRLEARFPEMIKVQAASAFKRIDEPLDQMAKKGDKYEVLLQPLTNVHLFSKDIGTRYFVQGDIKYIYIFSAIALFIILLACVNFMNLATAQSGKRAKEVGIRKVLGSERKQLIRQFLAESFMYTVFAAVVAVAIVTVALPGFNQLASKSLNLQALLQWQAWAGLVLLIVLTALFAGSYPAFFLTAFKPVSVLKGKADFKTSKTGFSTRNVLVVFQFTVSAMLIICTIVVYKQLLFNQSKDLGYNKENVLVVNDAERLGKNQESFRNAVLGLPEVTNATVSTDLPASEKFFDDDYTPETTTDNVGPADKNLSIASYIVDESFVPTLKLQIVSGRNFSKSFNDSASVILNETAAKKAGWKNPIGEHLIYPGGNNTKFQVVGVVKDFNAASLHDDMMPWALFYTTSKTYTMNTSFVSVRLKPGDYSKAVNKIQAIWKTFMPDNPFEYSFLDQQYDALYKTDQTIGKVFTVFTFLSITVACLGLLGLAMYTAERRTKEIGIRKVLGASVQNVVGMLSKDFLKLVLIASFIAFPVAWFAMNNWLQDFAYKTDISWWVFALATGIVTAIALITISFQSIKAAMGNPVESLRSE
jgi:putative ABC transport system permease protein